MTTDKVDAKNKSTWEQITRPLRQTKKKISEEDVNELVHKMR